MSGPAHTVRLHILLCDGLSGLSRVIDRLAVLELEPRAILFRRGCRGLGHLHLEFNERQSRRIEPLALRLEQIVPVLHVRPAFIAASD
jgi:hypothetical protein